MKIRTSSCLASSVRTAAFRIVVGYDRRGLLCRLRREILTLRRLTQNPVPVAAVLTLRGRIRSHRNIKAAGSIRIAGRGPT